MGIYTSNRYFGEAYDYASEIPANEAYNATFGCAQVYADCQANDIAMFESAIYSDIAEVNASINEGYTVINENAFTDVLKKIMEMFKKLLAKIKGIFKAFIAKLAGVFKKGKQLVKDYEKQIIKYSNWKDFKCKGIRKPKSTMKSSSPQTLLGNIFVYKIPAERYTLFFSSALTDEDTFIKNTSVIKNVEGFESIKSITDGESEDIKKALLKSYLGDSHDNWVSDWKDLSEDLYDYIYDDKDDIDGDDDKISGSWFSSNWIKGVLNNDKWIKDVEKIQQKAEKVINKIIDDIKKTNDNLAKWMLNTKNKDKDIKLNASSGGYEIKMTSDDYASGITKSTTVSSHAHDFSSEDKDTIASGSGISAKILQKAIHALQTVASNDQEAIIKVNSLYMEQIKFAEAQARKLWSAAAAWSSGVHKESYEYVQAVAESASEEFYMDMESL